MTGPKLIFVRAGLNLHADELLDAMYDGDPDVERVRREVFGDPIAGEDPYVEDTLPYDPDGCDLHG